VHNLREQVALFSHKSIRKTQGEMSNEGLSQAGLVVCFFGILHLGPTRSSLTWHPQRGKMGGF
jgi:hypothetical protein